MAPGYSSRILIIFFVLFFLSAVQDTSARQMAKHDDHDHNEDPSQHIFFTIDALKKGKSMPLYISPKSPSKSSITTSTPHLLSKEEANSIPFSSSQLPYLLQLFSISKFSPQAQAMNKTLSLCELEPIKGETKLCATSLESMLDFTRAILGLDTNLRVLTTSFLKNPTKPFLQNYTVLEAPREVFAPKMVACHSMPYPYAVFYCHSHENENRVFEISLESGENGGGRVEAVGVCHVDTTHWERDHISFRVLKIKPGTSPVCHVFPPDNFVWVPLRA